MTLNHPSLLFGWVHETEEEKKEEEEEEEEEKEG
jgi:hypothetical protein